MPDKIVVEGLDELRRSLKVLGGVTETNEFKSAGFKAGAEVLIPRAKARAAGIGRMQTRAADTLKPVNTVTGAAVRFGGGFAGSFGAEFGAYHDKLRNVKRSGHGFFGKGWNQFDRWRGSGADTGYFIWPTIRADEAAIVNKFNEGLDPLLQRLFPQNY